MADGPNQLPRPQSVPILGAHDRITDVQRRNAPAESVVPYPTPVVFVGLLTTTPSPPYPLPYGYVLDGFQGCLGTAGATDTVLTFYLNGASVFTLTLTGGSTSVFSVLGQNVGGYHAKLTIAATTIGTGAANLGGHLRWMPLP